MLDVSAEGVGGNSGEYPSPFMPLSDRWDQKGVWNNTLRWWDSSGGG